MVNPFGGPGRTGTERWRKKAHRGSASPPLFQGVALSSGIETSDVLREGREWFGLFNPSNMNETMVCPGPCSWLNLSQFSISPPLNCPPYKLNKFQTLGTVECHAALLQ